MSIKVLNEVWLLDITPTEMLFLQAVGDCANDQYMAHPSINYLRWKTGLGRTTIVELISKFKNDNVMIEIGEFSDGGAKIYRLNFGPLPVKKAWRPKRGIESRGMDSEGPMPPTGIETQTARPPTAPPVPEAMPPGGRGYAARPERNKEEPSGNQKNRTVRPHEMPADFHPKESHRKLAGENGVHLDKTFEAFADFHRSKGNRFKDWNLALNTWIRNEAKFSKNRSNGHGKRDATADSRDRLNRELSFFDFDSGNPDR